MNKIFNLIIKRIVNRIITYKQKHRRPLIPVSLERSLSCLMPGKNRQQIFFEYYNNKIKKVIYISFIMCSFLILYIASECLNPQIINEYYLQRNDYGKNSNYVDVEANINDNEKYTIEVEVKEREYSNEEAVSKMNEVMEMLPDIILNNNKSLEFVTNSLDLITSVDKYPFSIRWESSNYNVLQDDGNIGKAKIGINGENVNLKALISYHDICEEKIIPIRVVSPVLTYEEQMVSDIKNEINRSQMASSQDEFLKLPDNVNGMDIEWREKNSFALIFIFLLFIIMIIASWVGVDNDISRKYKERNTILTLEYSEFVSKLQLLIGSGMTIRGAFEKMGKDYCLYRKEGGKVSCVYEELILCNKRMKDGLSEAESYDYFGRRCSLICYKKLATLLTQNLRKGTDGLVYALSNETKIAFEERKQQAKRLGEEAQTKLLFPMILMLTVVMIIIMIPAYMSFGGL